MIQSNELRIGNWVNFTYKHKGEYLSRCCQVISISERDVVVLDKGVSLVSDFHPIPLSAEILEKAGFSFNKYHGTFDMIIGKDGGSTNGLFITLTLDGNKFSCSVGQLNHFSHEFGDYKYLHQLQNLVHIIAGIELIINL